MGRFLKKDNRLTLRVALAEESPSERHPVLLAALEAAVDAAEQHLRRRKAATGLPSGRRPVGRRAVALAPPGQSWASRPT